jgi:hypothetical protein
MKNYKRFLDFFWWYAVSPFVTFSSYHLGSLEVDTLLQVLTLEKGQLTFQHSNDLSKVEKNTVLHSSHPKISTLHSIEKYGLHVFKM